MFRIRLTTSLALRTAARSFSTILVNSSIIASAFPKPNASCFNSESEDGLALNNAKVSNSFTFSMKSRNISSAELSSIVDEIDDDELAILFCCGVGRIFNGQFVDTTRVCVLKLPLCNNFSVLSAAECCVNYCVEVCIVRIAIYRFHLITSNFVLNS